METVNIILGQQQLKAGNVRAAEKLAIKALSENPKNEAALDLRFDCFIFDGDYKAAKKLAEEWLSFNAESIRAHESLFLANAHLKNKIDCKNTLEIMKQSFPNETLSLKIREALYDMIFSGGKKAREIFKELSEQYPNIQSFVKLQADTAFKRDQLFTAHRFYKEAIRLDPTHDHTWYMYAVNSFHLMRFGEARRAARKALELNPKRAEIRAIIFLSWFVYFPVFYLTSLLGMTYLYISEFFGKLIAGVASFLLGYFVFAKMLIKVLAWLSDIGININTWFLLGGILLWLIISHGTFHWMENKKSKTKSVKLSDY